eukprot:TRINITY_DN348_c2_g1_i1.p1 TRINITY_DN348_c2_g1~~TRINITY_DN348_c2_g1_i1.p1  ORF type:complete len:521 (+),score=39.98 TRINITY_DN348_c2_g1_i1:235-1563(+)
MAIFIPILVVDVGSEALLLIFHDLPLCKKEKMNWPLIYVGLVGQIMTVAAWFGLALFVLIQAILATHPDNDDFKLESLSPGVADAAVVLIVFFKNIGSIPSFFSNKGVYPIMAAPQMLYLYYLLRDEPNELLQKYEEKQKPDEKPCCEFTQRTWFTVATNFVVLIALDFVGLISVSTVFKGQDYFGIPAQVFGVLVFSPVLILDILSESLLLYYHDLVLLRGEDTYQYRPRLKVIRVFQVFVTMVWVALLAFLIYRVVNINCVDTCYCNQPNAPIESCSVSANCTSAVYNYCFNGTNATDGYCTINGTCILNYDDTYSYLVSLVWTDPSYPYNFTLSDCYPVYNDACYDNNPDLTDCVLLAIIVWDAVVLALKMYFRSHIYPITVSSHILFSRLWRDNDKEKIVIAMGRMEFGPSYEVNFGGSGSGGGGAKPRSDSNIPLEY